MLLRTLLFNSFIVWLPIASHRFFENFVFMDVTHIHTLLTVIVVVAVVVVVVVVVTVVAINVVFVVVVSIGFSPP